MRKSCFDEYQLIAGMKSVEAGGIVKDICREAGISEATYANRKYKYCGMKAPDLKKIR